MQTQQPVNNHRPLNLLNKIKPTHFLGVLVLITLLISLQQYLLPERFFWEAMRPHYNNFLIFKNSFGHLINGLNLYSLYPAEYGDYFKYSPTFALFMAPFYYLPDLPGIILWNLLNVLVLYVAVINIPSINNKGKLFILLFVLFELIGNLQNEQSNALMTGFIILSFVAFERKNMLLAALFIILGFYLKVFGLVTAVLFIFYPDKKKFIAYFFLWLIVLGLVPLLVASPEYLADQYFGWAGILLSDHSVRYGYSVLGALHVWFGMEPSKIGVLFAGILLLCSPLVRFSLFSNYQFRLSFVASILLWVVLFNHSSEPPGYILAMTGCAIWFFWQPMTKMNIILLLTTFSLVSLSTTDLVPPIIRNEYVYPYLIKTFPVLVVWLIILFNLIFEKKAITEKPIEKE